MAFFATRMEVRMSRALFANVGLSGELWGSVGSRKVKGLGPVEGEGSAFFFRFGGIPGADWRCRVAPSRPQGRSVSSCCLLYVH